MLTCSICGEAAVATDEGVHRSCIHDAPVIAELSATCTGESQFGDENDEV